MDATVVVAALSVMVVLLSALSSGLLSASGKAAMTVSVIASDTVSPASGSGAFSSAAIESVCWAGATTFVIAEVPSVARFCG